MSSSSSTILPSSMTQAQLLPGCPMAAHSRHDIITSHYHHHKVGPNQCSGTMICRVAAPIATVWSIVRCFDRPQTYKHFIRKCRLISGQSGTVGCVRQVEVVSGVPATTSMERLEIFDEENHVIGFKIIGGDHRLQQYTSTTTLHPFNHQETVVVESYVVDVPPGNTKEETCAFVDTILRCNLQSLSNLSHKIFGQSDLVGSDPILHC